VKHLSTHSLHKSHRLGVCDQE